MGSGYFGAHRNTSLKPALFNPAIVRMRFQLRNENDLKDNIKYIPIMSNCETPTGKVSKIFELSCEACDAKRGIFVFTKINTTKITFNSVSIAIV